MKDFAYLGWNAIEIRIGHSLFDPQKTEQVKPDLHVGGIRNCSCSPGKYIGITAQDRTNDDQVLAVYDLQHPATHVLVRQKYILYNSLNKAGTKLCYTQPSAQIATADLYLLSLDKSQPRLLLEGGIAQDCVPAWFPDNTRVAYHTPQGNIEIYDTASDQHKVLKTGKAPIVSPDGRNIAFRLENDLFTWSQQESRTQQVPMRRQLFIRHFADGLSWSPDGTYLSFGTVAGAVGKEINFHLLEISSGNYKRIETRYLSGLLLLQEQG